MTRIVRQAACVECGRTSDKASARGLCPACYQRHRYNGTLVDFERQYKAADEVLEDWAMLRDDGYGYRDAAPRLGMAPEALDAALVRAKRRGDPRGSRVPFAHDMTAGRAPRRP